MSAWVSRRGLYAATVVAILAFAALLAFALTRLAQVEREIGSGAGENLLWALMQAQQDSQLLLAEASLWDRSGKAKDETEHLRLRYDIAVSRFALLDEGEMGRRFGELGFAERLAAAKRAMHELEPRIDGAVASGTELQPVIRSAVQPIVSDLRSLANRLTTEERKRAGERRDRYQRIFLEVFAAVVGIILAATFLIAWLLWGLWRDHIAERALRRERDFLELLLDSSGDGIMAFDRDLRVNHWNASMTRLLGIPAHAIVGRVFTEALRIPDDHPVARELRRTLAGENGRLPESFMPFSDRIVEKTSFPLRSGDEVIGGMAVMRDVTERVQAQRALARNSDDLERQVQEQTKELEQALGRERSPREL